MNTLTFVITFIFAANKSAFYDFGVQRRKGAKIFACFLSGQIWPKNMTRATALFVSLVNFLEARYGLF